MVENVNETALCPNLPPGPAQNLSRKKVAWQNLRKMWRMSFLDMALAHSAQWSQILGGLRHFTHHTICLNFFQIMETFGLVIFMKKLPDLIFFFSWFWQYFKEELERLREKFFNQSLAKCWLLNRAAFGLGSTPKHRKIRIQNRCSWICWDKTIEQ